MSKFRKKPVVIEAITFDELVAHGLANGANVVNGMPWSFTYGGHHISHENDACYLIPTLEGTKKMVIDVESVGLHGEGFAVGWVVLDEQGKEISADLLYAPAYAARGTVEDREWIEANVLPTLPEANSDTTWHVRQQFWDAWMALKADGPVEMWAECGWPVEANFLAACVADEPTKRNWEGPYPLHDVATLLQAAGRDPLATYPRLPSEEPAHNPLADARQSARMLLQVSG